jgi:hypothetical protein
MSALRSMYSTSESSEEIEEPWSINWSLALIDEPINDLIYKSTNQRRIDDIGHGGTASFGSGEVWLEAVGADGI